MADFDIRNDVQPKRKNSVVTSPTIGQLKVALNGFNSTSYSVARLNSMTENDMLNAIRVHGLTVNTTVS